MFGNNVLQQILKPSNILPIKILRQGRYDPKKDKSSAIFLSIAR